MAPILVYLRLLEKYTDAELTASVMASLFAIFIKTEGNFPLMGQKAQDLSREEQEIKLEPGMIINLMPGESIDVANPLRPNSQYESFVNSIIQQISSAVGLPYEFLLLQFQSSYSAARAALLQGWKAIEYYRSIIIRYFCNPVLDLFVALYLPNLRGKYKANWIGPSRGSIDELKDVKAAQERIYSGFSTLQRECEQMTGMDWEDIQMQRKKEIDLRKKLDIREDIKDKKEDTLDAIPK